MSGLHYFIALHEVEVYNDYYSNVPVNSFISFNTGYAE